MKQITLKLVLAAVLLGIVSCGGSGSDNQSTSTTPPVQPTEHRAYTSTPLDLDYSSAIWHVDFDNLPLGDVTFDDMCQLGFPVYCMDFGYGNVDEDEVGREARLLLRGIHNEQYSAVEFLGSTALKIKVDPSKHPGIRATPLFFIDRLGADYDELYSSYRVYYPADFDPGRGFKGLGGLVGVAEPYLYDMGDVKYPTGCSSIGPDEGFSVRHMGRLDYNSTSEFRTETYLYHQDKTADCGDSIPYTDNWKYRKGLEQGYLIETRVKMNTPGERNGEVEVTKNGIRVQLLKNLVLSQSGSYGINHFDFHGHYGGADHSWNPMGKTYIIIDDLAITLRSVHEK